MTEQRLNLIESELRRLNNVINVLEKNQRELKNEFMSHRDNQNIHKREGGCLE